MCTTMWEFVLLVLYVPLTLLYLFCGCLAENADIHTIAQWFEYQFIRHIGPLLGLLTFPCLIAAIRLRKKGKCRTAAWLRSAPLLVFTALFLIACLLRWILQ